MDVAPNPLLLGGADVDDLAFQGATLGDVVHQREESLDCAVGVRVRHVDQRHRSLAVREPEGVLIAGGPSGQGLIDMGLDDRVIVGAQQVPDTAPIQTERVLVAAVDVAIDLAGIDVGIQGRHRPGEGAHLGFALGELGGALGDPPLQSQVGVRSAASLWRSRRSARVRLLMSKKVMTTPSM